MWVIFIGCFAIFFGIHGPVWQCATCIKGWMLGVGAISIALGVGGVAFGRGPQARVAR